MNGSGTCHEILVPWPTQSSTSNKELDIILRTVVSTPPTLIPVPNTHAPKLVPLSFIRVPATVDAVPILGGWELIQGWKLTCPGESDTAELAKSSSTLSVKTPEEFKIVPTVAHVDIRPPTRCISIRSTSGADEAAHVTTDWPLWGMTPDLLAGLQLEAAPVVLQRYLYRYI